MSCCGKKRSTYSAGVPANRARSSVNSATKTASAANFQNTGPKTIVVAGPVTGRRYRFEAHGSAVAVDARDRRSLEGVHHLKRVI